MAIPDFQSFFLPVLQFAADGKEHTVKELREYCYKTMKLTDADLEERISTGGRTADNRIQWAKTYLSQAKALDNPKRGVFSITDRGRSLLAVGRSRLTNKDLLQFPEFKEFLTPKKKADSLDKTPAEDEFSLLPSETPEEQMDRIVGELEGLLASDLLEKIKAAGDRFFEDLVVKLIRAMGYGVEGKTTPRSRDGGIDGIIKEDALGLDSIYLQAKLWSNPVGSKEIQAFIGALATNNAQKGIFITTSDFTKSASECAAKAHLKLVLMNGCELVEKMIKYKVGVQVYKCLELKRVDLDFFEDA